MYLGTIFSSWLVLVVPGPLLPLLEQPDKSGYATVAPAAATAAARTLRRVTAGVASRSMSYHPSGVRMWSVRCSDAPAAGGIPNAGGARSLDATRLSWSGA